MSSRGTGKLLWCLAILCLTKAMVILTIIPFAAVIIGIMRHEEIDVPWMVLVWMSVFFAGVMICGACIWITACCCEDSTRSNLASILASSLVSPRHYVDPGTTTEYQQTPTITEELPPEGSDDSDIVVSSETTLSSPMVEGIDAFRDTESSPDEGV